MKVLVLGADGQVGRELMTHPAGAGLSRTGYGRAGGDVTDLATLQALFAAERPDVAINVAAYTAVDRAEDDRDAAFAVNDRGAANVAKACAAADAVLIHVSTDFVFAGALGRPYREDDAPNPVSVYGASKNAGEEKVRGALARHLIVRTAWVFGAHGRNFVKTILGLCDTRDRLRVVADQRGMPTPARNLAGALLTLAQKTGDTPPWGTYHLAGAGDATWHELATAVAARHPKAPPVDPIGDADYPTRARRPADSRLDCAAIADRFGVRLPPWREGLADVLDELLAGRGSGA